jgi:hypothetical protein
VFTKHNVEQAGVVRLNNKKEHLFKWDFEKSVSDNRIRRICPYASMNEIRIPWNCPNDRYLPIDRQFQKSMDIWLP